MNFATIGCSHLPKCRHPQHYVQSFRLNLTAVLTYRNVGIHSRGFSSAYLASRSCSHLPKCRHPQQLVGFDDVQHRSCSHLPKCRHPQPTSIQKMVKLPLEAVLTYRNVGIHSSIGSFQKGMEQAVLTYRNVGIHSQKLLGLLYS